MPVFVAFDAAQRRAIFPALVDTYWGTVGGTHGAAGAGTHCAAPSST
jgi:hypothetical protein